MKLVLASLFTFGILFCFLLSIIASVLYILGIMEFWLIIIFLIEWLLSPYLSDIVF